MGSSLSLVPDFPQGSPMALSLSHYLSVFSSQLSALLTSELATEATNNCKLFTQGLHKVKLLNKSHILVGLLL